MKAKLKTLKSKAQQRRPGQIFSGRLFVYKGYGMVDSSLSYD